MKALPVLLSIAAVGALAAVLLILRSPADGGAGEERVASDSTVKVSDPPAARKSVLLNAGGAVIEEFSGDCAGSGHPSLCRQVR
ncbi:hypothetical protein GCM10014719_63190 [Planomonospora parontospora subsp. antibiotica]|nr:hypothetical protein GCM10014719_63190 [Planomonospora parontospora subsp. antibiotica]GII19524.1 hypothetical protein Ppa05_62500 [Planomonospora parontospora subsp. antibiotica]